MAEGNGTQRDIGRIEGRLDGIDRRLGGTEASLKSIHESLDKINGHIERQKGGWKALAAAGGVGGTVVGVILKLWPQS